MTAAENPGARRMPLMASCTSRRIDSIAGARRTTIQIPEKKDAGPRLSGLGRVMAGRGWPASQPD